MKKVRPILIFEDFFRDFGIILKIFEDFKDFLDIKISKIVGFFEILRFNRVTKIF